jgi:hypothetical protein
MKTFELLTACSLPPMLLGIAMLVSVGCENKEKVVDIEGPRGQIEVERDRDTGEIDVDATKKEDSVIDVDTPGVDVEVNRDKETGDVEVK